MTAPGTGESACRREADSVIALVGPEVLARFNRNANTWILVNGRCSSAAFGARRLENMDPFRAIYGLRSAQYGLRLVKKFIFGTNNLSEMNVPENLKYTKDHEWIRVEGNEAFVGVTDFAQSELGDIVYVEIETEGEELDSEEVFGTIEAVKTVSDLFMPVSGTVVEVNASLESKPETVNQDPYGEGWMIKVSLSDAGEVDGLLSADQYKDLIG